MLNKVYDFSGDYVDRSEIHFNFDGMKLIVSVENQSDRDRRVIIEFGTVLKFDWECDATLAEYPNEPPEVLFSQDAEEYLHSRRDNDHPFLTDALRRFSVFFVDLGRLSVIAKSARVVD